MKELYCFDMRPIDSLSIDDEDEDEGAGLADEKAPRQIGEFIRHDDYNDEVLLEEGNDELR